MGRKKGSGISKERAKKEILEVISRLKVHFYEDVFAETSFGISKAYSLGLTREDPEIKNALIKSKSLLRLKLRNKMIADDASPQERITILKTVLYTPERDDYREKDTSNDNKGLILSAIENELNKEAKGESTQ